jgi:pimeloyl-ACP methyl ester carboxylesterase
MGALTHRTVQTNGIQMHVAEQGEGPVVVLCHGFPELWHSWRHQIGPIADAGYRVVVPDQRGYGRTERPEAIEAYDIVQLTGDLVGLLDALEVDDAVFIGHDWGAPVVWNLSLLAPARVRAVAALSVPFTPRSHRDPISALEEAFAGRFFYILYFQTPGVADAELAADVDATFRRLLRSPSGALRSAVVSSEQERPTGFLSTMSAPGALPSWLTAQDLEHYVTEFTRTGFTGGLNWYRNLSRNWRLTESLDGAKVAVPALFLWGEHDPVALFMSDAHLDTWVPDLRAKITLAGAGHWVQQERPAEVNGALLAFLASLD